jgi:hypothetical protein
MNARLIPLTVAGALGLGLGTAALAQDAQYMYRGNYTYRIAQAPAVNLAAGDAMCRLRIWVDDRARVSLRGDQITVDTNSGKRSFDEGSTCTQPLPAANVANFTVSVERGRGQVIEVREPDSRNRYAGSMTIVDPQNGGDNYEIVVAWHNPGAPIAVAPVAPVAVAPVVAAPTYVVDEQTRRCQMRVRGQFLGRNPDTTAFLDFTGVPTRESVNSETDVIRGEAVGGNRYESRSVSYQCEVDPHSATRVTQTWYELHGPARRVYGMR